MAKTTDETAPETAVAVPRPLANVAQMITVLEIEASVNADSGVDASLQIMENILAAETEEDLFQAQEAGTTSGKDFVNKVFRMTSEGIEWRRSRQTYIDQGGFPFFFLARILDVETNQELVINCGGKTVVSMVHKLQKLGGFDRFQAEGGRPLMLRANAAESGNDFLTIHPVNLGATV